MNIFTPLKVREEQFIKRLNEKYPQFEYVSGYIHSDKPVLLKCKICNYQFKRNADCVREGRNAICPHCETIARDNKRVEQQIINELLNKQKEYLKKRVNKKNKEINNFMKWLKHNTLYIKKCIKCNNEYIEHTNSKYCTNCRKKIHKKHSCKSLQKLYKRDNGICYLCGGKCNLDDYIILNGNVVCGDYYPSIEHVIPISKGGTDDWNNIRLAHRICNTLKGNKQEV